MSKNGAYVEVSQIKQHDYETSQLKAKEDITNCEWHVT